MFTKACEYAIRACVIVAQNSLKGNRVSLKEIARAIDSPEAFTAKILQQLVKSKLIYSVQGPQGGFEMLSSNLEKTTLEHIVIAIDGRESFSACVLGLKDCSEINPCPAHKRYKHIKNEFIQMLKNSSLLEMVHDIEEGKAFLKISS